MSHRSRTRGDGSGGRDGISGRPAATPRAVGEVAERERRGDGSDEEAEPVSGAVHLADPDPREPHLHAHAPQNPDRPGPDRPGNVLLVPEHVPARNAELAAAGAGEEHLEGAAGAELVPFHAQREDATREAEPLQHVVGRRRRRVA